MMGPRTAHERLQNPIFQLLKHLLSKKKMLKIGYIYIYKREINRNCRIRVIYDEARDNVAPGLGDCENIRLL
jgi:hypothetical protein